MAKYNDLDIKNWKQYDDIYTDTLWLIDKRDNSGAHSGSCGKPAKTMVVWGIQY